MRAKARLIARGFGQREGIDYFFDTFWRMVQETSLVYSRAKCQIPGGGS